MNPWLVVAGLVAWFLAGLPLLCMARLFFRRGVVADEAADVEYRRRAERRVASLAATPGEVTVYRQASVAIRGPTSLAEREVAKILDETQFD